PVRFTKKPTRYFYALLTSKDLNSTVKGEASIFAFKCPIHRTNWIDEMNRRSHEYQAQPIVSNKAYRYLSGKTSDLEFHEIFDGSFKVYGVKAYQPTTPKI
ncbi:hypothetical protein, partial [Acinetobacter baumannii]